MIIYTLYYTLLFSAGDLGFKNCIIVFDTIRVSICYGVGEFKPKSLVKPAKQVMSALQTSQCWGRQGGVVEVGGGEGV